MSINATNSSNEKTINIHTPINLNTATVVRLPEIGDLDYTLSMCILKDVQLTIDGEQYNDITLSMRFIPGDLDLMSASLDGGLTYKLPKQPEAHKLRDQITELVIRDWKPKLSYTRLSAKAQKEADRLMRFMKERLED